MVIEKGKVSKTPNGVKPVKNTNKNSQSFLKVIPAQKQVSPSHKFSCLRFFDDTAILLSQKSGVNHKGRL